MKTLSLVGTKSYLTQLDRLHECKLTGWDGWVSTFRVKEFKGHAHFNSIQSYFIFFFQKQNYHIQTILQWQLFFPLQMDTFQQQMKEFLSLQLRQSWCGLAFCLHHSRWLYRTQKQLLEGLAGLKVVKKKFTLNFKIFLKNWELKN